MNASSKLRGGAGAVCAAVVVAVLVAAAGAWACTPQSTLVAATQSAEPGARVAVSGQVLQPGQLEIRWNAVTGPALAAPAMVGDKAYAGEVTIPQADPGVYYMVLTAADQAVARVAFEVSDPAGDKAVLGAGTRPWGQRSGSDNSPAPAGSSAGLGAGVALLSLGLVGLSASGLAFATLGRRRAPHAGR